MHKESHWCSSTSRPVTWLRSDAHQSLTAFRTPASSCQRPSCRTISPLFQGKGTSHLVIPSKISAEPPLFHQRWRGPSASRGNCISSVQKGSLTNASFQKTCPRPYKSQRVSSIWPSSQRFLHLLYSVGVRVTVVTSAQPKRLKCINTTFKWTAWVPASQLLSDPCHWLWGETLAAHASWAFTYLLNINYHQHRCP